MTNGGKGLTVKVQLSGHTIDNRLVPAWEYLIWLLLTMVGATGYWEFHLSRVAHGTDKQKGVKLMSTVGRELRLRVQPEGNGSCWEVCMTIPRQIEDPAGWKEKLERAAMKLSEQIRQNKKRRVRKKKPKRQFVDNLNSTAPMPALGEEPRTTMVEEKQMTEKTKKPRFRDWDQIIELLEEVLQGKDFFIREITEEMAESLGVDLHNITTQIGRRAKIGGKGLMIVNATNPDGTIRKKNFLYRWVKKSTNEAPEAETTPAAHFRKCLQQAVEEIGTLTAEKQELVDRTAKVDERLAELEHKKSDSKADLDKALLEEAQDRFKTFLKSLPEETRANPALIESLLKASSS